MNTAKAPPEIFSHALLKLRRGRAARRGASFLAIRSAKDAADRLCDVNRQFEKALIIGAPEFSETLLGSLPANKLPANCTHLFHGGSTHDLDIIGPDDKPPFEPASFDLIISGLSLHTVNDLPGALINTRRLLNPDGLFIGAMLGGETLTQLRRSAYAADEIILGGLTPRVLPFADYSQAAALLQRSGFALPVVDMDRVTVRYKALQSLISDLRDMGDMNSLTGRDQRLLGKAWRKTFFDHYEKNFSEDERFLATFEVLWMTGWAPHENQQKPLKPGSAKMRLADALGVKENPAKR